MSLGLSERAATGQRQRSQGSCVPGSWEKKVGYLQQDGTGNPRFLCSFLFSTARHSNSCKFDRTDGTWLPNLPADCLTSSSSELHYTRRDSTYRHRRYHHGQLRSGIALASSHWYTLSLQCIRGQKNFAGPVLGDEYICRLPPSSASSLLYCTVSLLT